jgi:putative NADPH-quinone reductase
MAKRIAVIQGHPDPAGGHFCHALADAYARAARAAGHEIRFVEVSQLDFSLLRNAAGWEAAPADAIAQAQSAVRWAQHIVILFPLWLGDMPALLKGFLEQLLRPGFAFGKARPGRMPPKLLQGRSARVIVTMGMPALFYRLYYRAHSVRSLERNILAFVGIAPVRTTLIGMIEKPPRREAWLRKIAVLGATAR